MRRGPPIQTTFASDGDGDEANSYTVNPFVPTVITPTSHDDHHRIGIVHPVTPDDVIEYDVHDDIPTTGHCQKMSYQNEINKAREDAKEAAMALENLVKGIQIVKRYLQTPLDDVTAAKPGGMGEKGSAEQQQISSLSNQLVGILGSELMGLMNAADMVRDHAKLHAEEASMLLEDLTMTKIAYNKSNDRADRAESVCRKLYREKQALLQQVDQLRSDRRNLSREVKSLRRAAKDTKKFDTWRLLEEHVLNSVAIHEMILKTPTRKLSSSSSSVDELMMPSVEDPDLVVPTPSEHVTGIYGPNDVYRVSSNDDDDDAFNETGKQSKNESIGHFPATLEEQQVAQPPQGPFSRRPRALAFPSGMSLGFGRFKRNPKGHRKQSSSDGGDEKKDDDNVFEYTAVGNVDDDGPTLDPPPTGTGTNTDEAELDEVPSSYSHCTQAMEQHTTIYSSDFGTRTDNLRTQHHASRILVERSLNVAEESMESIYPTVSPCSSSNRAAAPPMCAFQKNEKDFQMMEDYARSSPKWSKNDVVGVDVATVPTESSRIESDEEAMTNSGSGELHGAFVSPLMTPVGSSLRGGSNTEQSLDWKPSCDPDVLRTLAIPSDGRDGGCAGCFTAAQNLFFSPLSPTSQTTILYEC